MWAKTLMITALFAFTSEANANAPLAPPILEPNIYAPLIDIAPPTQDTQTDDRTTGQAAAPIKAPVHIGVFSLLHKVTARVQEIRLVVGEETPIESLMINMRECISAPPEDAPETRAFLEISETPQGNFSQEEPTQTARLFTGWMFASSPGIHALDHPVYDIWVLSCITENGKIYTGIK